MIGSSLTSKRVATSSTSSDHDKSAVNREGTNKSSPHGGHRHSADTTVPSHSHHHHHHHHHHAASRYTIGILLVGEITIGLFYFWDNEQHSP